MILIERGSEHAPRSVVGALGISVRKDLRSGGIPGAKNGSGAPATLGLQMRFLSASHDDEECDLIAMNVCNISCGDDTDESQNGLLIP